MPDNDPIAVAVAFYRLNYGPITREDMERAAAQSRNFHTMAELCALRHAGIEVRA